MPTIPPDFNGQTSCPDQSQGRSLERTGLKLDSLSNPLENGDDLWNSAVLATVPASRRFGMLPALSTFEVAFLLPLRTRSQ